MANVRVVINAALVLTALCAASPAFACPVGGVQILFEEEPDADEAAEPAVIRVHFSNAAAELDALPVRESRDEFYSLIGAARLAGGTGEAAATFPVYAMVTSCTHEFFGRPPRQWNGDYFLIGRFAEDREGRYFMAGGVRYQ